MAISTEVCNLALGHLAVGKEIANADTEVSADARACRRYYDIALNSVLRDYPWGFAKRSLALALIEEDPNDEWGFSYQYPTDCVFARRIQSGSRVDTEETRIVFEIAESDTGQVIYTDKAEAILDYTKRVDDAGRYPADFKTALSYRLAAYIAPTVTAGDPFKLGDRALQNYLREVSRASSNAQNEAQTDVDPTPELIRARNT